MLQSLDDAGEELKRVDHMVYVSLKYTRTSDVLKNIIARMVDAYIHLLDTLLKMAKNEKRIIDIPSRPLEKANLVRKLYEDEIVIKNVELFLLLREILHSDFKSESEFRRHVAIIVFIRGKEEIINIDNITEYYHMQRDFYKFIRKKVLKEEDHYY
ncbi:MAG: hypothetical protein QXG00_00155 [Candidatus Woesearchaeota archaeon]